VVFQYEKEVPNLDTNNQNPEYLLEEEEFKVKLQKAISSLSEAQREVFLMNRIEGKKYREIAELLDISQKAVEKRMSAALKILKSQVDNI
jgi:RNA polymerase sigma-70 factor (ECF subfamily)